MEKGRRPCSSARIPLSRRFLSACAGCIVPREEIMNSLWQSDEFVNDNTLTVNMNRLRRKLESMGSRIFWLQKGDRGI